MRDITVYYTIDATAPTFVSYEIDTTVGAAAKLKVVYSEPINIAAATLTFGAGSASVVSASSEYPNDFVVFSLNGLTAEAFSAPLTVSGIVDNVGNAAADQSLTITITVDLVAPSVDYVVPMDGSYITNPSSARFTIVFTDDSVASIGTLSVTSPASVKVRTPIYRETMFAWSFELEGYASGDTIEFTLSSAVDLYGNAIASYTGSYTVDTEAPAISIVIPNSETYNGVIYSTTNSVAFPILPTEAVQMPGIATGVWNYAGGSIIVSSVAAGEPGEYLYTPAATLPEGAITFQLKDIMDLAGNKMAPYSASFVVDTVPPTYTVTSSAKVVGKSTTVVVRFSENIRQLDDTQITGVQPEQIQNVLSVGPLVWEVRLSFSSFSCSKLVLVISLTHALLHETD
jgi:hypothetical protein